MVTNISKRTQIKCESICFVFVCFVFFLNNKNIQIIGSILKKGEGAENWSQGSEITCSFCTHYNGAKSTPVPTPPSGGTFLRKQV